MKLNQWSCLMNKIHITLPGNLPIKKNSSKTTFFQKVKGGGKKLRQTPIHYYQPEWKEYAKSAIQRLAVYKTHHPEIEFPIRKQINLRCLIYRDNFRDADITNLVQGIEDLLAGNSGVDKDFNINPSIYQILEDDNLRFIGSLDGTRCLIDLVNPR